MKCPTSPPPVATTLATVGFTDQRYFKRDSLHSDKSPIQDYAPDRGYKPSSTPFTKESAYMGTYRALPVSKREEKPWADAAKRLTNLYAKETDQTAPSCYSSDFQTKVELSFNLGTD